MIATLYKIFAEDPNAFGQVAEFVFGGCLRHRRDQRAHHLSMPAQRGQAQGRAQLPDDEIDHQQSARRRRASR